ncbi:Short-chain dehydrogenase [Cognatiyoonia koreensis]|uniref:Short-chain dehydrogenase n=1 Tax=Cognatiyoonia koreensis TaxID=364200 RepID=A0A1I0MSV9_9RHOB|nr:SDR family NAD(P)-dependent oxidoreductase [Cognatiyoonia koreensis]SEV91844.1 Short-chain dehydrogenase [Cognatiyoonia koreensis]
MEKALVIGASGGIGRAVVSELEARGVAVTQLSRSADGLDVTDAESVDRHMDAVDGPFDLVFSAVGVLGTPEKALSALTAEEMSYLFKVNTIGPALLLRHASRLLPKDGRGVFGVLSARVGSIGDNRIGGWYSYRASKAAVNQIVHGAAIELKRTHRQSIVVALHPGTVETPFTAAFQGRHKTVTAEEAATNLVNVMTSLTPDQTGGFYAYDGSEIPW